jgi:CheY-like chemotaxis protein
MDGPTTPRVLLVDDEPRARGILSRLLNAAGFVTSPNRVGQTLKIVRSALGDIGTAHISRGQAVSSWVHIWTIQWQTLHT